MIFHEGRILTFWGNAKFGDQGLCSDIAPVYRQLAPVNIIFHHSGNLFIPPNIVEERTPIHCFASPTYACSMSFINRSQATKRTQIICTTATRNIPAVRVSQPLMER